MTEETRQADIQITPAMITAGVYALQDFGDREDFQATSRELIVRTVFDAMLRAVASTPSRVV